ncbi:unnamed protein product [Caenorhabditis auriculariae]|uniref:General vesicular transport factor p115 n=1 Tax=Caenorhabditis auriculariae TaxID=2777116 RepID=A0A8S1HCD9_9PELO|nr:unnamed protein product [Caenorhabditis auriculariae]
MSSTCSTFSFRSHGTIPQEFLKYKKQQRYRYRARKRAPLIQNLLIHPPTEMALFRNFFGGGPADPEEENGAELVERFVERVETCSAPEDRRDAIRALRSLAKKYRLAVGTMGMNSYVDILEKERMNHEILALVLDTLSAVLSSDDENVEEDELGERLAEVMLKRAGLVSSVLAAIEQFDFGVRRTAVQLLTSLLRHRGPEVQASVMGQPMGVSKLVDIVHDNREIIRNEAILMLCELSRSNAQIQQLLAYDNLFVLLFDVVDTEPLDSIVIEDCLFVTLNLLRKNAMNQQLFRENNLIARLGTILHSFLYGAEGETDEAVDTGEWAKQRTANVIFLLQIVRALVSPDNAGTNTHAAQKAIYQTKILAELCRVLLSEIGASVEILTESIIVVAESIRGNYTNQEYFASTTLITPDQSTRPSLLVLLISMTAEKQPFKLRCSVFYCFLSYLFDNEFGKTKIIETLLPSSQPENAVSTGALICQAISSSESVQCWFGCVSLMHCLYQVEHLCEQLLRVQLTVSSEGPSVSLLSHVSQLLTSMGNRRPQMRAGVLMLLGVWLNGSPQAVTSFVAKDENLQYLTTHIADECGEGSESEQQAIRGLIAFSLLVCLKSTEDKDARSSLEALIERRVGKEAVISALEGLSRTEQFVRAAQKPQPLAKQTNELFLDFHFVKLFKNIESSLVKQIRPTGEFNGTANNDSIIQSFKELIKRQDEEISVLKHEAKRAQTEITRLQQEADKSSLEKELEDVRAKLEASCSVQAHSESVSLQLQEAQRVAQQWYSEAERYKQWAAQWQSYQLAQIPNAAEVGVAQLQQQIAELEQQLSFGYQAFEQQSQSIVQYTNQNAELREAVSKLESALATKEREISEAKSSVAVNGHASNPEDQEEVTKLRSEQEDLLVLLAEQHNKMTQYRRTLKSLGQPVTDDEDE